MQCASRVHFNLFLSFLAGAVFAITPGIHSSAAADEFYKGKTINLLIGNDVGGDYDTQGRLIGRYLPQHIPGNPTVIPQNMVGASGLRATNFIYNSAPRDGLTIGMVAENLLQNQAFGENGVQYDARRLNWVGSITQFSEIIITWSGSGIRTIDDAKKREVIIGASTKLTIHYVMTTLMNTFLGTKFKIVTGYKGGNAMNLAVERGEVDGRVIAWSALKTDKPDWVSNKKVNILAQLGPKAPDLPGIPNVEDLVSSTNDLKVIDLFTSANRLGRPLAVPPDTPPDRVSILRVAFDATMKDPAFINEAKKLRIDVNPVRGVDMEKETREVLATPAAIIQKAKALMQ